MTQTITELLCQIAARLQAIDEKLAALLQGEGRIERQEKKIMASILDGIEAQATQLTTLKDSLNATFGVIAAEVADLNAKLAAAGVDPALIAQAQAIQDTLTADNTAIHDAIVANTPAAPLAP